MELLSNKTGIGWGQWSDDAKNKRHSEFLKYAFDKGLDWRSPEANYGFLARELSTTYKSVIDHLRSAGSVKAATDIFEREFEGANPRKAHMGSRYEFARHVNLLQTAQNAGVLGGPQKVSGEASLRIDLNGFPRGTRTATKMSGLFKEIKLDRGATAPWTSVG